MKLTVKFTLLPLLLLSFTFASCGKKEKVEVPEKVKTAFTQKFPEATDAEWDKEKDTEWEAEFKMSGKEYSANFSTDGQWLETEYEITVREIPANIKTNIDSSFTGYTIKKAELSEKTTGKVYEIKVEKAENKVELVYDSNGTLVKQTGDDTDKEEEKEEEGQEEDDEKNDKK